VRLDVITDVAHHDDAIGRDDVDHSLKEAGAADAAGENRDGALGHAAYHAPP
jgi:hypothetical protein